jgi:hypothetical protein
MLTHSPPLPLVIDYIQEYHGISTEDEQRAILALKQRDRVRRISLELFIANLQKLLVIIKEEYPILEHLTIRHQIKDNRTFLTLPETLEAPHLRHLTLVNFAFRLDFDYSLLPCASSHFVLSRTAHLPTSIQILCSNGFRQCLS